ncbi:MAG: DEAD/DEAH box helicase [Methanosarcinales archaeon]|nr:DEAD/DEAH box helicase [Methanosarcinales archaeon]
MSDIFNKLHPRLQAVLSSMGFTRPTEPQVRTIPKLLKGDNLLLIAPTGSGKTESAILPVFHHILNRNKEGRSGISALYITPLRALNRDMLARLEVMGAQLDIDVQVRHGDTSKYQRQKQSKHPPDVLITTPETLQIMLTGSRLRKNLESVQYVVVDEVHELAASKRGAQLSIALERLVEVAGEFQRIGLSATVGSPVTVARFLAGSNREVGIVEVSIYKDLEFNVVTPQVTPADRTSARSLMCTPEMASHLRVIGGIVESHISTLIFVNTREAAEALGSRFRMLERSIGVHHGSLSKETRIEMEDMFKSGGLKGLICTSSMELGIDIGDVDHVVQYMSPREVSRLIQRVGRAGHRIHETSKGTIITTFPDDVVESWAIIHRAHSGMIEETLIHEGSTDTLANQIAGMVLDFGELDSKRIYDIVTRAYPYHHITQEQVDAVLQQVGDNRLVWHEEDGRVGRRRKSWQYYYANLSMIPDEKKYDVLDIVSGRPVGALDEIFIVNFIKPGAVFIARGEMWRVMEILHDRQRIKVEPVRDPGGEIPSWVGEEIPVPFGVADGVSSIRAGIGSKIKAGLTDDEIARDLMDQFPTDMATTMSVVEIMRKQVNEGFAMPAQDTITVEDAKGSVIINICGGHKVNNTIGGILSALLSARLGTSVAMEIDPYRIKLDLPGKVRAADVVRLIMDLDPAYVEPIIEMSLKHTTFFKWKMIQVAKKFGAINTDADYERISLQRLLDVYEGTPMYDEAVREIFQDKLDIGRTVDIIGRIAAGEILLAAGKASPIGISGFVGGRDLVSPARADASIIEALKQRIMNDRVILFCVTCKKWVSRTRVSRVQEIPECPLCESRMIAALKPWEEEEIKVFKIKEKTADDLKRARRVYRNASLVLSHGRTAVIALASRGLGPETASRVIRKMRRDEDGFYRDILEAERNYVRTKRFWD